MSTEPKEIDALMRRYTFKLCRSDRISRELDARRGLHSAFYNALLEQRNLLYNAEQTKEREFEAGSLPARIREVIAPFTAKFRETKTPTSAGRIILTAFDQGALVRAIAHNVPEYSYDIFTSGELEQTVKRLDLAFRAFLRRMRELSNPEVYAQAARQFIERRGRKPTRYELAGYPQHHRLNSFGLREMKRGGWAFKPDGNLKTASMILRGIGDIRLRGRFPTYQTPKGRKPVRFDEIVTGEFLWRDNAWWFSLVVKFPPEVKTAEGVGAATVTFDLVDCFAHITDEEGVTTAYTNTDGVIYNAGEPTPDDLHVDARVADLQRQMKACEPKRGERASFKYRDLRRRKQSLQAHLARKRQYNLHLWTSDLAKRYETITVVQPETPLRELTKSARGSRKEWGAEIAFKAEVNREYLAQSPGLAIQMLEYKVAERSGTLHNRKQAAASELPGKLVEAGKEIRKQKRVTKRLEKQVQRRVKERRT